MLRNLVLAKEIKARTAELEALQEKDAEFAEREKSLTADIEAAETKEEREAVEDAVNAFDTDLKAHEERKANLTETINTLRHELEALEAEPIPAPANVAAETKNERFLYPISFLQRSTRWLYFEASLLSPLSKREPEAT